MNWIHPTAIIGKGVKLGKNNTIGPYCIIDNAVIGDNNTFQSNVIIGSPPEHKDFFEGLDGSGVLIGNNNVFREFITVNTGIQYNTHIGNDNILLRGSHVGHDVIIGDNCTISCNVLLGGFTQLLDGVNCGLGSITHQYSILGHYSMLGMGTIVTKQSKIEPGNIYVGSPAKYLKKNMVGLERANVSEELLKDFTNIYNKLCTNSL